MPEPAGAASTVALESLPAMQREAVRLHVLEEVPYPAVAAALDCSEVTARKRVSTLPPSAWEEWRPRTVQGPVPPLLPRLERSSAAWERGFLAGDSLRSDDGIEVARSPEHVLYAAPAAGAASV
ncbi:MAG: sigma-70 region 4 domain-containing protein [Actinomycetota bacterium]|nr:sigma-70 region 4 domain-containing protein [Actinomycetota bacterium]